MLKKLFTLAATTALLGANVAAHAIDAARAAGQELKPIDGTKIQPSIPPMPPMEKAQPAPGWGSDKKVTEPRKSKATKAGKATKARARTSGSGAKAKSKNRQARLATRHK